VVVLVGKKRDYSAGHIVPVKLPKLELAYENVGFWNLGNAEIP
jgi:hypothetical protein